VKEDFCLMNEFDMEKKLIVFDNNIELDQYIEVNKVKDLMIEVKVRN
jgi:hypothetical protein